MELTFLGMGYIGAGIGAGLVLIGAASGIGRLAASALEGTARQPEAADIIRTTMIIAAALIEGIAFLGLIICLLIAMNFGMPKEMTPKSDVKIEQTTK
ncbi:MAG: ATP synthase F0 subunit C [Elusimicrobiales bacterium]